MRTDIAMAVPFLRMAVVGAIKHALGLPASVPPAIELPPIVLGRTHLIGPPGLTFLDPTEPNESPAPPKPESKPSE